MDPDRGRGVLGAKELQGVSLPDFVERSTDRRGLRELDYGLERMPGLNRQQRDLNRAFPRERTAEITNEAKRRTLPGADVIRRPFSSRQKKARSKSRIVATSHTPKTERLAMRDLVTDPETWAELNTALSDNTGDAQALDDRQQRMAHRVDRAIQRYEQASGRGHVIYSNVRVPGFINSSNVHSWLGEQFPPGRRLAFDRYTYGTHQMHETAALDAGGPGSGHVMFEIETTRGAYLGHSDSRDDTSHLLPRASLYQVAGSHWATYATPDGSAGRVFVVQLRDITPDTTVH